MKKLFAFLICLLTANIIFAGDAAVFDDIGFSQDGKTYIFGQYGKTDKTYKAWAEIYTVDVKKNDYVKGEVYKSNAKSSDESSGKKNYENFKESLEWKLAKYNAKPANAKTLLFLRETEKKSPTDEIIFKDFESSSESESIYFHIKLVPSYEGKGKNVMSKYYIDVKRLDQNNNVLSSWKIGTPDFKRKGITSYQIDKIFTDDSGKSLVFVIQKTLEDDKGTSIRYMVETFRIED